MAPLSTGSMLVDAAVVESSFTVHSGYIVCATVIALENCLLPKLPLINYRTAASFYLLGSAVPSRFHSQLCLFSDRSIQKQYLKENPIHNYKNYTNFFLAKNLTKVVQELYEKQ